MMITGTSQEPVVLETGTVTPMMTFSDADGAIDFYVRAFGAEERFRLTEPSGKIGHAEIRIGRSVLMLSDEYPDFGVAAPETIGGSPVRLQIYVEDADEAVARAVAAGALLVRPVTDEFYGDRAGTVTDPYGYTWLISARVETLTAEEMQRRWDEMLRGE